MAEALKTKQGKLAEREVVMQQLSRDQKLATSSLQREEPPREKLDADEGSHQLDTKKKKKKQLQLPREKKMLKLRSTSCKDHMKSCSWAGSREQRNQISHEQVPRPNLTKMSMAEACNQRPRAEQRRGRRHEMQQRRQPASCRRSHEGRRAAAQQKQPPPWQAQKSLPRVPYASSLNYAAAGET